MGWQREAAGAGLRSSACRVSPVAEAARARRLGRQVDVPHRDLAQCLPGARPPLPTFGALSRGPGSAVWATIWCGCGAAQPNKRVGVQVTPRFSVVSVKPPGGDTRPAPRGRSHRWTQWRTTVRGSAAAASLPTCCTSAAPPGRRLRPTSSTWSASPARANARSHRSWQPGSLGPDSLGIVGNRVHSIV